MKMAPLAPHPTRSGWLIVTSEIEALLNTPGRLVMPDGSQMHLLYFRPPDFLPSELDKVRTWALSRINEWRGQMKKEIPLSDYLFSQLSYVAKSLAVKDNKPQHVRREARMRGLTEQQMLELISLAEENWADRNDLVEAIYIGMSTRLNTSTSIEELANHLASLPASLADCEAFYASEWPE